MLVTEKYLVPEYYINFHCKGPNCRSCCCHGFNVSITLSDYYRLLGITCSKRLRHQLDCSFKILDNPTPDCYAVINPGWDGDCPLHGNDGYCALQKQCGEAALSAVCRYFPRSPKTELAVCSCSNSCEKVLELLMAQEAPMQFTERVLTFDLPDTSKSKLVSVYSYSEIRNLMINTVQQRKFSLPHRIYLIGERLRFLESSVRQRDYQSIHTCISQIEQTSVNLPHIHLLEKEPYGILMLLLNWFGEEYPVLAPFTERVQNKLNSRIGTLMEFEINNPYRLIPGLPIFLEQVIVNHMFYTCFPFSDSHETLQDKFTALSTLYSLLNVLIAGCLDAESTPESLIDLCAAFFRVVEHTSFDRNLLVLLHRNGVSDIKTPLAFLGFSA